MAVNGAVSPGRKLPKSTGSLRPTRLSRSKPSGRKGSRAKKGSGGFELKISESSTKGRSLLTDKTGKKIAGFVEKGNRFYVACALAGIAEDTGRNWLSEGRKWPNSPQGRFVAMIEMAQAKAEKRAQDRIQHGIKKSWVAAAWWLTHGPSRNGWTPKMAGSGGTKVTFNIQDQIKPKAAAMAGHVLEAEFQRLDTNMKMIEQHVAID